MNYLIYQITNKINGKKYIGQHQTEDINDGYMGGGKGIKNAIKKYGKENFEKRILFNLKSFEAMNEMEKILVDEWFVNRKDTYNQVTGGHLENGKGRKHSEEIKNKQSEKMKGRYIGDNNPFFGKNHTDVALDAIRKSQTGRKHTDEHRRKNSESNKGKKHTEDSINLMKKIKENVTKDTRKKMSEWQTGRVLSDEHRSNISKSRTGIKLSEEGKLSRKIKGAKMRLLKNNYSTRSKYSTEIDIEFLRLNGIIYP